jgi:hypothetical protein
VLAHDDPAGAPTDHAIARLKHPSGESASAA